MIAQIEARIAEWTHLPAEYGEPIQACDCVYCVCMATVLAMRVHAHITLLCAVYCAHCAWAAARSHHHHHNRRQGQNGRPSFMQILRYQDGQKYDAHWDWFDDPVHHK